MTVFPAVDGNGVPDVTPLDQTVVAEMYSETSTIVRTVTELDGV